MHDSNCKSLVVLTTYPPQYQECDCGEDYIPQSWSPTLRKMAKEKYQELKSRIKHYPECADSVATVCICSELSSLKNRLERIHHSEMNELAWMNGITREDSFRAGYLEGIEDCIAIANNEKFLDDDGKHIRAMSALWNIITNMYRLKGKL